MTAITSEQGTGIRNETLHPHDRLSGAKKRVRKETSKMIYSSIEVESVRVHLA